MAHDPSIKEKILTLFGDEAYTNGHLNRQHLASMSFHDPAKLKKLNSIVHPAVAVDFENWYQQHAEAPYVLKEAALLLETGSSKNLDIVINVHAASSMRKERVLKRDPQRDASQVDDIMSRQMSDEERMARADYTIYNDGSRMLIPQVIEMNDLLRLRRGI